MSKLEREVGQQLLAKNGRGVRLTDAGRLLAEHAARILSQVELAQSDLEAQRGQVVGELRLSAFPTAARGLFPAALAALRADHPGLRVRSSELEPEAGVAGVVRGDLDLAVVLDWYNKPMPLPDGLVKAAILDDPADVAMPVGHRHADRAEVDLGDFADDEWITWGEGEFCHEWLMFTLRSKGIEPHIGHRAAETHTQLGLVAAGLGVCVAPSSAAIRCPRESSPCRCGSVCAAMCTSCGEPTPTAGRRSGRRWTPCAGPGRPSSEPHAVNPREASPTEAGCA